MENDLVDADHFWSNPGPAGCNLLSKPATVQEEPSVVESRLNEVKSEINLLHSSEIKLLPDSEEHILESLRCELESSLTELKETLSFTKSQCHELQSEVDQETQINQQLKSVVESVKKKLETDSSDGDDTQKELQEKISEANQTFQYLRKNLVAFIKQHFPLPSQETLSEAKKKLRSADYSAAREDLFSMKEILELLLNKSLEDPNDPFITIDHQFWPPYVELLLRSKIVVRHKDDEKRIKLVSFHL
ncbi:hypothetical protein FSP39_010478 [Pinctada imbricata]|uniref:Centromere protein K n=1 Tax=Pinctada imbricata TaxID=66713 RepID=A0AA88Y076_PINIB|nr:hypothetical protein FSP39_010478 [Pinctada imbricata]